MEARRYIFSSLMLMAVAASTLLLVQPLDASPYQHVTNGGFEQGVEGWRPLSGSTLDTAGLPDVEPTEGDRVARGTIGESEFAIQQLLSDVLAPGVYGLSIDMRSESVALSVTVILATNGSPLEREAIVRPDAWMTIRGEVTIPLASTAAIKIHASGAVGDVIYIDNVRLVGAPPVVWTPTPTLTPTSASSATIAATATGTMPTPGASATATPVVDAIGASLRNGGFENGEGVPFAWKRYGGSLSAATSPVHSGERAARLESSTASTKWLHQMVSVNPGGGYAFEAWIAHADPNVASAFLRVSWYASDDGSGEAIGTADSATRLDAPADGYRYLTTGGIAPPSNARTARVRIMLAPRSEARAVIYVDDASWSPAQVVATPVPLATVEPPVDDSARGTNAVAGITATRRTTRGTSSVRPAAGPGTLAGHAARVVINEVLYDPIGDGPDAANEWVELYNAGSAPAVLSGWTFADAASAEALPDIVVEAGGFAVIAASGSFRTAYPQFTGSLVTLDGRIGNALNNDGDALMLVDATGAVVDAISWGANESVLKPAISDVPAGHSIERRVAGTDTNDAADFVDNESPSPGAKIGAVGGKPTRQTARTSQVEVIEGSEERTFGWLPWALAASSVSALGVFGGWRVVSMLRERVVARG